VPLRSQVSTAYGKRSYVVTYEYGLRIVSNEDVLAIRRDLELRDEGGLADASNRAGFDVDERELRVA